MEKKGRLLLEGSVKGNLKFWGKRAEKLFLSFVLFVLLYTFLMSLSFSSLGVDNGEEVVRQFKMYVVILGILWPLFGINSYGVPGIGIAMSFGARRLEIFWGVQFMAWLSAIQIFLFVAVGNYLTGGSFSWMGLYLPVLMMSVGVGELMGCAGIRFGWKGVLFTVLCFCIVGGGAGILFFFRGGPGVLPLLAAAVLMCAAAAWCWKKILSGYEVKVV